VTLTHFDSKKNCPPGDGSGNPIRGAVLSHGANQWNCPLIRMGYNEGDSSSGIGVEEIVLLPISQPI